MPTVVRLDGFRVVLYTDDHEPPHVHVFGGGGEVQFYLNCMDGPIVIRKVYDLPERVVNDLKKQLQSRVSYLCGRWEEFHD